MLPLLDLHGVARLEFHSSVVEVSLMTYDEFKEFNQILFGNIYHFQELREKLITKINEIGQKEGRERDKKLKDLLVRSFPLVKVKQLRPIIMSILKCTNNIEDKYLKVLVSRAKFLKPRFFLMNSYLFELVCRFVTAIYTTTRILKLNDKFGRIISLFSAMKSHLY